jgi:transcriptional regulator with XRE-family HTH domain
MAHKDIDEPPEAKAIDPARQGFGLRLKAAREAKKLTQHQVAERFSVNKATVSAWETGRGAPDAFVLAALAKLYDVSADALLWEASLSPDAMKIATEYDHLPSQKQADWRLLWLGFISGHSVAGENLPLAPDDDEVGPAAEAQRLRDRASASTAKKGN